MLLWVHHHLRLDDHAKQVLLLVMSLGRGITTSIIIEEPAALALGGRKRNLILDGAHLLPDRHSVIHIIVIDLGVDLSAPARSHRVNIATILSVVDLFLIRDFSLLVLHHSEIFGKNIATFDHEP